jgi:hypothetical protein
VTYGGLSLTKQKGYDPEKLRTQDTFHSPPARKGIYAFIWPYVEKFLLGGNKFIDPKIRGKGQRNRIAYVKDKEGNVIKTGHPDFEKQVEIPKNWSLQRKHPDAPGHKIGDDEFEYDKEFLSVLYNNTNRKKFSYNGPLWHHLKDGVKQDKIIDEKGAWIKTDPETYVEALKKTLHQNLSADREIFKGQALRGVTGGYGIDHLEVFIDQKI